jgi:hypothetical protein
MAQEIEIIRSRRMSVNPVVMRPADRDEIVEGVLSSLGAHQPMMRINPAHAGDLRHEASGDASSVAGEHLLVEIASNSSSPAPQTRAPAEARLPAQRGSWAEGRATLERSAPH